jgi:hypothetical protein
MSATDASVEEAGAFVRVMRAAGLDTVFGGADEFTAPAATDRGIFERIRISGFAYRRHGRARFAFRSYRAAGPVDARHHEIAAGSGIRHFAAGACSRIGAPCGGGGGGSAIVHLIERNLDNPSLEVQPKASPAS